VHAMLRGTVTLLFFALVTLASSAGADATFALQWRDTGTQTLTILPGDAAAGGQRTLDILMTIDVQWTGLGVSVGLPDGSSLSFAGAGRWNVVEVPGASWIYFDSPTALNEGFLERIASDGFGHYQEAYHFDAFLAPPCAPPWAQPGTHLVGWMVLDTSAVLGGATVEAFFWPAIDVLGIDDGTGALVASSDATFLNATLGTAQLLVVPEPATGALVAAGLLLLGLTRRR